MAMTAPDCRRDSPVSLALLLGNRPSYTPLWTAEPGDPGRAVLTSYASMLSLLWERLYESADKNKLQFLADLGIDSLPPAAARAPVVLEPLGGNALAAAGSLVGATGADGRPLTFRTEFGIGLSASPLAEVWSVVPQADTVAQHSTEIVGGRPAQLFEDQSDNERCLYIGHSRLLAFDGSSSVELEIEFREPSRPPLKIAWSTWDGSQWREFEEKDIDDHTAGMTARGTITIKAGCITAKRTTVNGVESFWLRGVCRTKLTPDPSRRLPTLDQLRIRTSIVTASSGQPPEAIIAAGVERNPQEPIEPFGSQPRATTLFYVANDAILARTGDAVTLAMTVKRQPLPKPPAVGGSPVVEWEYWNGDTWTSLGLATPTNLDAAGPATVQFTVPQAMQPTDVNGRTALWIRARLDKGSFDDVSAPLIGTVPIEVRTAFPPTVSNLKLSFLAQSRLEFPEYLFAQSGPILRDGTSAVRFRGTGFELFADNPDRTPTLYLGFDGELPAAALGLYFEIESPIAEPSHEFRWEQFDGREWVSLPIDDETAHLTRTGILRLVWPGNRPRRRATPVAASGDTATVLTNQQASMFVVGEELHLKEGETGELVTIGSINGRSIRFERSLAHAYQNASLAEPEPALFGTPRTWIRARLTEGEAPPIIIRRLLVNAAWVSESVMIEKEMLGSGDNEPNQLFRSARTPILEGEIVQVRELSGPRARTDLPILQRELAAAGRLAAIETDVDPAGEVVAVWVEWQRVPNLRSSEPDDRHYLVDRADGQIMFGGDGRGRAVPTGVQNVRLRRYETGGGRGGNVAESAIATPLSGIIAKRVWNPVAATGGADREPPDRAALRAPRIVRHRYQAVTAADYRDVAIEASPEVFDAAVVPVTDDLGSALRLLVLANSDASPPAPSAQLLETVNRHVRRRCPASVVSRLRVGPPAFVEIGVTVEVAPLSFDVAGQVFDRVRAAMVRHLHPVRGGLNGAGWRFGSVIHVAHLAPALESVEGVDFVSSFTVTARHAIIGDSITLGADELPTAGVIRVMLISVEGS